jgi:hypothetical protein
MAVILTRQSSTAKGSDTLGEPTDTTYFDGLLDLFPTTRIADAVDWINEVLQDLAPAPPESLLNIALVSNRTPVTGKMPDDLNIRWYQDGKVAGNTIYVIPFDNLVLSSPNPTTRFGRGGEGTLKARQNDGGAGLSTVATLDISANFDSDVIGPAVQDLTTWDTQGTGDPCTDATVNFTNGMGNLQVTYCGWHNDFNAWQRMNARLNVSGLDEGFNSFALAHAISMTPDDSSGEYKMWYDDDPNTLSFIATPTVVQASLTTTKYLSGVRYYGIGDTFTVNYEGANVYKKCYHISNVSIYSFEARSSSTTKNPITTPSFTDTLLVNEVIAANRAGYYDIDTRLTATLYHPWKTNISALSPSESRLYNGYGNVSTAKNEYFLDENYRLPNGSYDSIPTLTGQWNSMTTLVNGQALIYNIGVRYPNHNLTSTLPTGNPNYTGFTGNQYYLRGFYESDPHSNVVLNLSSLIADTDISPLGTGDVNLEVKLPTQTGWMDGGTDFNVAIFTGADGDGCKVSATGSSLSLTFGTFSTASSGGTIIIRITFRNTSHFVSGMSVNW